MEQPLFLAAHPYQDNVLTLPVQNIQIASDWYRKSFGMNEIQRTDDALSSVVLERDGVKIGFCVNGADASQDGAAILVSDIKRAKTELENNGLTIDSLRIDERDGKKFEVFFVIAPDGLCYYFHQKIEG